MSAPTIALIAERRHVGKRALIEALTAFEAAGARVELIVPDAGRLFDIPTQAPEWDAVLSRGRDLAGLGLLSAAAALGVMAINSPRSIELVRNKVAMHAVLSNHGIAMPRTWFAADPSVFERVPLERYPLIVKPFDGDGSRGLALLSRPRDIDLLPEPERWSLYLAQELLVTDGWDLKLYGIGNRVWAVRKRSPVSFPSPGPAVVRRTGGAALVPLDSQLTDIALTCGRACRLELWGVDVAITQKGPFVIEVNDFPTYSAVPRAGPAIAEHVLNLVEMNRVLREAGQDGLSSIVRATP